MSIVRAGITAMSWGISIILAPATAAQGTATTFPLSDASRLEPHNVTVAGVRYRGSDAVEVRLAGPYCGPDMDTFAFVPGVDFRDGTIEVDVAGSVLPTALAGARGFVGVAFRIDPESFACDGLYIRPANGRADDQVRRNHATQYFSYPGWDFDRLRREAPEQFGVLRLRAAASRNRHRVGAGQPGRRHHGGEKSLPLMP